MTPPSSLIRRALIGLLRHFPILIALLAIAAAAPFWIWVRQETSVTLNVFFGWRQTVIVVCGGIALAGFVVEWLALKARQSPADRPLRSLRHAALTALPYYAVMVWLGAAMED